MIKNTFTALLLVLLFAACNDEKKAEEKGPDKVDTSLEDKLYQEAVKRNDPYTMLYALNTILAKDTSRINLQDTLLYLYLEMQNPIACAEVSEDILRRKPDDKGILQIAAESYSSLQEYDKAIMHFQKLYELTGDLRVAYQIGSIYANVGEEQMALEALNTVIKNRAVSDTILIDQPMPSAPNKTQKVKLSAMAYAMIGYMYSGLGNKDKGISNFKKAMEIDPKYDAAAYSILELRRNR